MYKKYLMLILLGNCILVLAYFNSKGLQWNRIAATPAFQLELAKELMPKEQAVYVSGIKSLASGQRIVDYTVIEKHWIYDITEEDYEVLLRIVEAEAGGEDEDGKLLVANVVLNRMNHERFPNTVSEVVFQQSNGTTQFSPVASGRFYRVNISEETVAAVERALSGEDLSQGAIYFAARRYANTDKMRWFDSKLTFLFSHGGHEFFY